MRCGESLQHRHDGHISWMSTPHPPEKTVSETESLESLLMAWVLGTSCPAPYSMVSGDKLSYVLLNYQKPHQVASEEQNFSYTLACSGIKEFYVYHAHHSKNSSEGAMLGTGSWDQMCMFCYARYHSFYTAWPKKLESGNEGKTVYQTIPSLRSFCAVGHNAWRSCFSSNCAAFIILVRRQKMNCRGPVFNLLLHEMV